MKRSEALASLSRDHHHALVVAKALTAATEATARAAGDRFVEFLEHHELAHFAVEEAVLLPMIPTHAPGPTLARQMLLDHAFFRDAVQRLRASGAPPDAELLRGIGQRLRDHVQMEERQLFPCLERSLSASELEEVSSRVEASPARRR